MILLLPAAVSALARIQRSSPSLAKLARLSVSQPRRFEARSYCTTPPTGSALPGARSHAPQCPAGARSGMLSLTDHCGSIDEHVAKPFGITTRLGIGSGVGDSRWIENHHVGEKSLSHETSIGEMELARRHPGHPMHSLRQGQQTLIARV